MRTADCDPSRAVARGLQRGVYKPHAFHALPNTGHEQRIRVRRTFFDLRGDLFGEIRVKLRERLQVSLGMSARDASCVRGSTPGAGTAPCDCAPSFP